MSEETVISLSGINRPAGGQRSASDTWPEGWEDGASELTSAKPLFHRVSYPPRLSLNGLLISMLCTLMLVFIGFVIVSLPSPLNLGPLIAEAAGWTRGPVGPLAYMQYSFQLPLMLLIGAFLGPFMGTSAVLLFLVAGLAFYPVFANGGGWDYLGEPGFGYLLGGLLVAHLLGKTFHKLFQKQEQEKASRSLKILLMAVVAMAVVHAVGAVYLVGLTLTGQSAWADLPGWLLRLSVEPLPYDILATAVFLCLVRQLRLGLWFVLY